MTVDAPVFHRLAVSVRPARVAVFVPDEERWMPKAMRCVECLTRTWGGAADVLIPHGALSPDVAEVFWRIAALFDPDWIGHYDTTWRGQQMASPEAFESWMNDQAAKWTAEYGGAVEDTKKEMFTDTVMRTPRGGRWAPPKAVQRRIEQRLAAYGRGSPDIPLSFRADSGPDSVLVDMLGVADLPRPRLVLDTSDLPEALQLVVATRLGAVAPAYRDGLVADRQPLARLVASPADLPALLQLVWRRALDPDDWAIHKAAQAAAGSAYRDDPLWASPDFVSRSPLGWTTLGLQWTYNVRKRVHELPFIVVIGDRLSDFCLGYDLDRLLGTAAWLPRGLIGDGEETQRDATEALARELVAAVRSDRAAILTSTSLSDPDLTAVRDSILSGARMWRDRLSGLRLQRPDALEIPNPWRLYGTARTEQIRHEAFVAGEMAGELETSQPVGVAGRTPESLTWQVDVRLDDYTWPVRSAIGPLLGTATGWERRVRSSAGGASYVSHGGGLVFGGTPLEHRLTRARLRLPTAEAIFGALLERNRLHAEDSDAGRFTRGTLRLFGGFRELVGAFKSPATNALLDSYSPAGGSPASVGDYLRPLGRRFLSFQDAQTVTGLPASELRSLIDGFLARGILWRGLALQCTECRYAGWYRLADLDQVFRCARCRASVPLAQRSWKTPVDEPIWQYELDEVVFQAVSRDVRAPILALDSLRGDARDFLFAPEQDVRDGEGRLVGEVDVWAIVDGRLLVGEAKTTDRMAGPALGEDRTIGRLVYVAEAITADELVFATTAPAWHPSTKAVIEAKLTTSSVVPRFIENMGAVAG